jgi:hygromycin-B 7''-O-kinase
VIQSRLSGRALGTVWPDLDRSRRLRLAHALGRTTAELHAAPGFPDDGSWVAFLEERRRRVEAHHRSLGAPGTWVERVGEFVQSVPLGESEPVFLHTELLDEHVLVEERGGRWEIAGLLDFADSRAGDPHYEFAAPIEFIFRGEPGCLPSFLRGYGWGEGELTPEAARRLAAWGLLHQFGSLPRVLEIAGKPEPRSFEELAERVYSLREP